MNTSSSDVYSRLLRFLLYSLVACTTLVIVFNTYESGIAKQPLLVLHASLIFVVACMYALRRRGFPFRTSETDVPVLIFLASVALAAILNPHWWEAETALAFWMSCFVSYFAAALLVRQRVHTEQFIRVLALVGLVVCVVALVQFLLPPAVAYDFGGGKEQRVSSTLGNATFLGSFNVLLLPVMLAAAFSRENHPRARAGFAILSAALASLLFAGGTRSSIAGFVASLALFFFSLGSKRKRTVWTAALSLALLFAAALYLSPTLGKRILTSFEMDRTSSFARRLVFWEAGYKAFLDAPLLGHGLGSCERTIMQFRSPDYWTVGSEDIVSHAHNEPLELVMETGVVGLAAYLLVVVVVVRAALTRMRTEKGTDRLLRLGFLCGLVAVLIDNGASMSLRVTPIGPLAWMWMGIVAAPRERNNSASAKQIAGAGKEVILLAAWLAFAVWYGRTEWDHFQADRHFFKGLIADKRKDHTTSLAEYNTASTLAPYNLNARIHLAYQYLITRQYSEALAASREVQTLCPYYPKANLIEAAACLSSGRSTEALAAAEREISLRNHPDVYSVEAVARKNLGDTIKERKALLRLLDAIIRGRLRYDLQPVAARSLQLARSPQERGELRETFERLHALFPDDAVVRQTLAALP